MHIRALCLIAALALPSFARSIATDQDRRRQLSLSPTEIAAFCRVVRLHDAARGVASAGDDRKFGLSEFREQSRARRCEAPPRSRSPLLSRGVALGADLIATRQSC